MNELQMIESLLTEAPPSEDAVAAGRERLHTLSRQRTFRIPRPSWTAVAGLGLVATATAAVVGIATVGGTSPGSPGRPEQARPVELSARSILLTAADKAAAEPVSRYWRVHLTRGQAYHTGPATGGYTVAGYNTEESSWMARSDSAPDVSYGRDLGAYPLTAADKAAWKKAGSPSTWKAWVKDHYATLSTKPGASYPTLPGTWFGATTTPAQKKKNAAQAKKLCAADAKACAKVKLSTLSWADRQKLASDPARFKELLFPAPQSVDLKGPMGPANQLGQGAVFLATQPASPQVRAAAFRLLAGLPDVRSIGKVTDAGGRIGIGLAARATVQQGSEGGIASTVYDEVLVLDAKTYQVLGDQRVLVKAGGSDPMKPGTILSFNVVLQSGWTSEAPHHP
jgi:hypothetical protein